MGMEARAEAFSLSTAGSLPGGVSLVGEEDKPAKGCKSRRKAEKSGASSPSVFCAHAASSSREREARDKASKGADSGACASC